MAASLAQGNVDPIGEMNTTPLIDVMHVLLVMFIITIPLQSHAIKIDVPTGEPPEIVVEQSPVNKVAIDQAGVVRWNGSPIDLVTLRQYLDSTRVMTPEPELHVQPDPNARYDTVDQVLAVVKKSEITKLGFVGNERYANFGKE